MSKIKMLRKEAQVALPNSGETYIAEDGTVSMVLDDHHDTKYEPTDQEITEYGEWLGMSFPEDNELLWIAREGLKAPLPKEWKPCKTDTGDVYYFNFKTGDSIWDHPMDEHFKSKFKTEKERLKKSKETGGVLNDPLSKLPSRNNIIFTEQGIVKHEALPSPVTTPRGDAATFSSIPSAVLTEKKTSDSSIATSAKSNPTSATTTPMKREESAKPSTNYSTTISSSVPSAVAAAVSTVQKEAADPAVESPRLVSEAEKVLQERVRQEAEAEHKKLLDALEQAFSQQMAKLRDAHNDDVAEARRQANISKRAQISKIEDKLQDELEQQQRNVDQRGKRDVQDMEREIDSLREKLREVQSSAATRIERESSDTDARVQEAVQAKVREIESEIASIRLRHAKAQMDAVEQESQRLELELNRASVTVSETTSADYEAKATQLRAQHSETLQRLRNEAKQEMENDTRRAASAAGGSSGDVLAELATRESQETAAIRQRNSDAIASLKATEAQNLQSLRAQGDSEVAQILRRGVSDGDGSAIAAIDADAESRIRSLHDQHNAERTAWQQAALMLRRQRIDQVTASVAPGGAAQAAVADAVARLTEETASLVAAREAQYKHDEPALRTSLEQEAKMLHDGNINAAVLVAVERDVSALIAAQQAQRAKEEAEFQASKAAAEEAHRREMADYESKVAAARGAPPVVTTQHVTVPASAASIRLAAAPAVRDAHEAAVQKAAFLLADRTRAARTLAAEEHSKRILKLADELASTEQALRRGIDSELQAAAAAYEAEETRALQQTPAQQNSPPIAVGLPRVVLDQKLIALRSEYASRERAIEAEYRERLQAAQTQLAGIRAAIAAAKQRTQLPAAVPQEAQGLPPRSSTPQLRHASPVVGLQGLSLPQGAASEAFAFLQEQQRTLAARHEVLSHARSEWQHDAQRFGVAGAMHDADAELHHQETQLRQDVGALRALEKYYSSQLQGTSSKHQHVDPANSSAPSQDVNVQIVAALHKLNDKLEKLASRVDHISRHDEANSRPAREGRKKARDDDAGHRGSRHRSSSQELSNKWSAILRDVTSKSAKGSRVPPYGEAIRQYLHAE